MKKILLAAVLVIYSSVSLGGGSIGGGGGSVQLENPDFELMKKTYIEDSEFRRLNARLSVDGVESLPVVFGDETLELQKVKSRIMDIMLSHEVLSLEAVPLITK